MRVTDKDRAKEITSEIKKRRTRIDTIRGKQKDSNQIYANEIQEEKGRINELQEELNKLLIDKKILVVSDHAILRYLERVLGVDVEKVRKILGSEILQKQFEKLGSGRYPVGDAIAIIDNSTIVTVYKKGDKE